MNAPIGADEGLEGFFRVLGRALAAVACGWWRPVAKGILGLLALGWLVGLVLFLRVGPRNPVTIALPPEKPHPSEEHNLVSYVYGPRIRASSYYRGAHAQHHPAYLVDGRSAPTVTEKWASDPWEDARPWVELTWDGEHRVRRVQIQHAQIAEGADMAVKEYTLTCLPSRIPSQIPSQNEAPLRVTEVGAAVATHALRCDSARGVRIDTLPSASDKISRLFEVEVWGQ